MFRKVYNCKKSEGVGKTITDEIEKIAYISDNLSEKDIK
jgi:hypothetical protein